MSYGFQCWNDGQVYQIDGETVNLVHSQTIKSATAAGSLELGRSNAGKQYTVSANTVTVTVSATTPLFVLYCPARPAAIMKTTNPSAGTWQVVVWTADGVADFELHVFDKASAAAAPTGGYGLQVFSSSGELVFNSNQRLARVVGFASGNIVNASAGWGQWQPPSDYSATLNWSVSKVGVAAMITPFVGSVTDSTAANGWYRTQGWACNGGQAVRYWRNKSVGGYAVPGSETVFGSQFDWGVMFVDLSFL